MDIQGRRTTRALSNVNENLVKRTAAGKDAVLTRRPALKDQRNGANIRLVDNAAKKPIAKATRSVATKAPPSSQNSKEKEVVVAESRVHPEVVGIDREVQFVEYCDQRTTRALSNVNENLVKRTAAGKDAVLTRRPALKDQRNGANIRLVDNAAKKPIAKATRSVASKAPASSQGSKEKVSAT
ncbi:hypothetical protein OESDEN_17032 [Oesophagostomum dentatum]|uniref:Uncharacterized protein n=1 Tax=Oesophagostomum dentatum TaxID=61180 RepID=A0A0B1SHA6_OESDE|nr:hypothetical protein OESDEN_17032 [Oesophagostomum dentatum]